MERTKIKELFAGHKRTLARTAYLIKQIAHCETTLDGILADYRKEVAEMSLGRLSPSIQIQTDGRHHYADPTSKAGVTLAGGKEPYEAKLLRQKIITYVNEIEKLEWDAKLVEFSLNGLRERDRWIIETKDIEGNSWSAVSDAFFHRYGVGYSLSGLKHIRAQALERAGRIIM